MLAWLAFAFLAAPDVVELKDGTRLVGERLPEKGVALRTAVGVIHPAAEEIAREVGRAELLPTHQSLVAGAGAQPRAWLTIGDWCLARGLFAEAFDACDRAADLVPRDAAVARLRDRLCEEAVLDDIAPADVPSDDARQRLVERVAGKSRARAAWARAALARTDGSELHRWLVARLQQGRPETRSGAAAMLAGNDDPTALAQLVRASLLDENGAVRAAARDSAAASRHPDLAAPYIKVLAMGQPELRERAYPMLEALRDPRSVPALIDVLKPKPAPAPAGGGGSSGPRSNIFIGEQRAYVRDFDVEIAQGAVIAKPVIGVLQSGAVLDVTIGGVVVISYTERVEVVRLLSRLTGQQLGNDPVAWETWWAKSGGKLPPVSPSERS